MLIRLRLQTLYFFNAAELSLVASTEGIQLHHIQPARTRNDVRLTCFAAIYGVNTELSQLLGKSYDKSNYDSHRLLLEIDSAIAHARRLHTYSVEPWPYQVGIYVYQLIASLSTATSP